MEKIAAVSLIENRDGLILCVWNRRYNGWSLPGGKAEPGETAEHAQARELHEETGVVVVGRQLVFVGPHNLPVEASRGSTVYLYRVTAYDGAPYAREPGCPVEWMTREAFLAHSPFASFYRRVFAILDEQDTLSLNDLRDRAFQTSKDKGFHDDPKSMGDYLALIHSEVSEALEDHRDGKAPDEVWYTRGNEVNGPFYDHLGGSCGHPSSHGVLMKPCVIPSEMADIVIRVLDFCGAHGIDIEKAVTEKMAFNATRPRKHGKTL